jgi:hypothetical protein
LGKVRLGNVVIKTLFGRYELKRGEVEVWGSGRDGAAKAEQTLESLQLRYDERLENVSENSQFELHEIYCIS